jgi:hypothetical protein
LRKKKTTRGKSRRKITARSKIAGIRRKKAPKKKKNQRRVPTRGKRQPADRIAIEPQGLGPDAGGQSGDIQGLSHIAGAGSESVEELVEEGQAFEAEVISGVENAANTEEGEVTSKEIPEDDVPPEYRGER